MEIEEVLGDVQKFLLFLTRETALNPNPLLFALSASAAVLYAFYAPPLLYSLLIIGVALISAGKEAPRAVAALGTAFLFTIVIYGVGFILTGRLPAEFLPTLLKAVDSTALFSVAVASRGATNVLLAGACISGVFNELIAVVKTASLAPGILRNALAAYAVYNGGRIDAKGAGFAVAYFLNHSERLYNSVSLALSVMGRPRCNLRPDPLLLLYVFAIGLWIWQLV